MKFQTVVMILLVATLASAAPGVLLKSLIKSKLLGLAALKSSLIGSKLSSQASLTFAGRVDTVAAPAPVVQVNTVVAPAPVVQVDTVAAAAPVVHVDTVAAAAPVVHVDTVAAPAPVVQVNTVAAAAPVVHVNTVHAPAPVVHVNTVVAPPPVVHVNTVHQPAPVVHLGAIHVAEPVYEYAPHHKTAVHYKEVHPVSESIYFGGEVHKATIGDSHSGSVNVAGNLGLDIRVDDDASSSAASGTAQFNYASGY